MTTKELAADLGREVRYHTGNLWVACRILDAKRVYGDTRYLITPLAGRGEQWVSVSGLSFQ